MIPICFYSSAYCLIHWFLRKFVGAIKEKTPQP